MKRQVNIRLEEELIEQLKEIAIEEQKRTGYDNITFTAQFILNTSNLPVVVGGTTLITIRASKGGYELAEFIF